MRQITATSSVHEHVRPPDQTAYERFDEARAAMALPFLPAENTRVADQVIASHTDDDVEAISQELEAQGLPSVADLGRIQVKGTLSWWRLHRKRKNILAKLG